MSEPDRNPPNALGPRDVEGLPRRRAIPGEVGQPMAPIDLRLRELGLQLVIRLAGAIRIGRAYKTNNSVFQSQFDMLVEAVNAVLGVADDVVLVSLDGDLFLNGHRIPVRSANVKFHKFLVEQFAMRQIAGLRAERGVEPAELLKFFEVLMSPEDHAGASLLEACLAVGCDKVQPAVHASSVSPDDDFAPLGIHMPEPIEGSAPAPRDPLEHDEDRKEGVNVLPGRAPKGAARKSYRMAVQGMRSLLAPTALQQPLEMRIAKRVVQPLVDGAFAKEPVIVGLSSLGHHDEYTYAHAVNVTLVSVTMGHALGLDRRALADLGVAALLHDVGKSAVADEITNSFEDFTDAETAAARRHPIEGVKLLARSTSLNPTTMRCMRVSLEHHMVASGRGYPSLEGWTPSVLSQIVSVADAYVSLQAYRSRHGANVTPFQALGMVLGPLRSSFHPYALWALVQAVGLYPPGQLVEIQDGRIALVIAPNSEDLERPNVRIIARADRRRMGPEEREDLQPLPATMHIVRALRAEDYPEMPEESEPAA